MLSDLIRGLFWLFGLWHVFSLQLMLSCYTTADLECLRGNKSHQNNTDFISSIKTLPLTFGNETALYAWQKPILYMLYISFFSFFFTPIFLPPTTNPYFYQSFKKNLSIFWQFPPRVAYRNSKAYLQADCRRCVTDNRS